MIYDTFKLIWNILCNNFQDFTVYYIVSLKENIVERILLFRPINNNGNPFKGYVMRIRRHVVYRNSKNREVLGEFRTLHAANSFMRYKKQSFGVPNGFFKKEFILKFEWDIDKLEITSTLELIKLLKRLKKYYKVE